MEAHRIATLAVALGLAACEPVYDYVPVTDAYVASGGGGAEPNQVGAEVTPRSGRAAASYPIPKEAPRGDLQVASYGLVDVGSEAQSSTRIQALHLRMTLTNNSDSPWTLDTRQQSIELEGFGTSVAAFASADKTGSQPPTITVPPKGKRVIDLFFPLPAQLQQRESLPSFEAIWLVQTDSGVVTDRTPFENMAVLPPAYDAAYDYGPDYYWGPPYWYNPFYADYGFGVFLPPFYFGLGYPLYVHHHHGYGHFAHYGHYYGHGGHYGGHGGHYGYGGYPHGGYPHGGYYPRGSHYPGGYYPRGGYPRGGYQGGGYPRGGYQGAYPRGGYRGGGYPGGGYRPGGVRPGGGYPGATRPSGGYRGGGYPGGARPSGGGYRGGGHPSGGGRGGGGRR